MGRVKLWRLVRDTNSILLHKLPSLHIQISVGAGHIVHGWRHRLGSQYVRSLHNMWMCRLNMTSLATCSTLLPTSHVRHALARAAVSLAVELIVLVMRHQAGTGCGMWGVDHRRRSQVWWSGGVFWPTW